MSWCRMTWMSEVGEFRVGDAEREAVADRIRDAYVEGRLSHDELDSRLEAIQTARTRGELSEFCRDLPEVKDKGHKRHKSLIPWTYIEVNSVLWGIWGVQSISADALHALWPLVVSVPWGLLEATGVARRIARRRTLHLSDPELPAAT
jgi:hypothetical protein